jgi:hypothetical protein
LDGSHTGPSDSDNTYIWNNYKGSGKGSWKSQRHNGSNQYGKRGRDPRDNRHERDDSDNKDRQDRDVRQKTWASEGKSAAENWARSSTLRTYMRSLTLQALKALLLKLRRADTDFQNSMKNVHYERWQDTIDENLLSMHKDLGMPIKLSILPYFYYQAAMKPCNNAINKLANTETLADDHGRFVWREIFNSPTYDNDITSCQASYVIPTDVNQLGQTNTKVLEDYKIACLDLELQKKQTRYYEERRHNFYLVAIVNDGKRQAYSFLDKNTHISIKRAYNNVKQGPSHHPINATSTFNRIFDAAYKIHFTHIRDEIELFAKHQTPLEYTQRFTPDINNLYYFNDDGTVVQEAL